jgi:glycine cleavage system H protein
MAYPAGFKYTKEHEWIEMTDNRGKVGITDYAQQQLGDVVYLELPDVGTVVEAGKAFGTIESVKAVSDLYAPVSGTIAEVNADLRQKPEAVNTDPHTSWMVIIDLSDPGEVGTLLDVTQYEALLK